MGVFVDIEPLRRYPAFRRLWGGAFISSIGSQLSVVAIAYEVYHLTGSNLDVGLVSLAQLIPSIVGSFVGGPIADAMDRHRLLLICGTLLAVLSVGQALDVARAHPSVPLLYLLAGTAALVQAVNAPAQTAMMISIVEREHFAKANALRQLSNQVSSVVGPTIAGLLISASGAKLAFSANALSFLVSIVAVYSVGARPPLGGTTRFGWRSIVEGFAFVKARPAIAGSFLADFNAMVLGMPTALFPAIALHQFHGGARTVGLLFAAPGVGAILGGALSGWTSIVRRAGLSISLLSAGWGVAIAAFGFTHWLALAVLFLALAGACDITASIIRGTLIQTQTPDRLRGRLSAIQTMVVSNGPRLGNTEAGLVAAATSTQFSVVSGGLGCVVGMALIARLLPRFARYEFGSQEDELARQQT
ncbi:MAG TPA: MFS transporter [Acidimicrobiales bacterium]|nr:MFS transporter [Acidimicrobiales bacterium]